MCACSLLLSTKTSCIKNGARKGNKQNFLLMFSCTGWGWTTVGGSFDVHNPFCVSGSAICCILTRYDGACIGHCSACLWSWGNTPLQQQAVPWSGIIKPQWLGSSCSWNNYGVSFRKTTLFSRLWGQEAVDLQPPWHSSSFPHITISRVFSCGWA